MLVVSLALQQIKEVGAGIQEEINTECEILTCISLALTVLGLVTEKSKLCRGHIFSNTEKIMVFISDVQHYVPIELGKTA